MSHHEVDDVLHDLPRTSVDSKRPHSIDLTLELERQLDNESLPPNSPLPPHGSRSRPQSLDPNVLASIVTQLRLNLDEVTKERDTFSQLFADAQAAQAELKTTLDHVSERCIRLETDLAAAIDKQKEDADAVVMLRGKLEDSRRALMRLQTESRRMSQVSSLTIDSTRASQASYGALGSGNKRASFTPLTGSPASRGAHRRGVSVSDSGLAMHSPDFINGPSSPPAASRRMSSFFGRLPPLDLPTAAESTEVEELRKELEAVKEQLEETRHELTESQEAREASETCVNALRTFIAENSIGLGPAKVSNSDIRAPSVVQDGNTSASKWSFKLWKSESAPAASGQMASPVPPPPTAASTPATSSRFGGFFSSRASVSSAASSSRPDLHPRPSYGQQEPMYNGSDSSSLEELNTEPVSPVSEAARPMVMVRANDEPSEQLAYPVVQPEGVKGAELPRSISDEYRPAGW
ncbi:hypothetical protein BXZ70DRAFT_897288 [Cristinia sonorae]|uniref:Uncharacterized protein n=1 Tax=Cristinia sonorae TaxID=1940300 RepID=A0A8K0XMI1_9AGAR|nr:hypothetical protein BXZ70DRAFT_897288 [Cristinia sonorae]